MPTRLDIARTAAVVAAFATTSILGPASVHGGGDVAPPGDLHIPPASGGGFGWPPPVGEVDPGPAWPPPSFDPCIFNPCCTNFVRLNTGYDHPLDKPIAPPGTFNNWVADPTWRIVYDPFPWTHEPRPAQVIAPWTGNGAWKPAMGPIGAGGSRWIGSDDTAVEDPYAGPTGNNYFIFETSFCARTSQCVVTSITARADDQAVFFLNPPNLNSMLYTGTAPAIVASSIVGTASSATSIAPAMTTKFCPQKLKAGQNKLYARVKRTAGTPVGLNVIATVSSIAGTTLSTPACCHKGTIMGRKYTDVEPNFVPDPTRLEGVPIRLTKTAGPGGPYSATTLSDHRGNWSFLDVPAGTYNVSELTHYPCFQTVPFFGGHSGLVVANTVAVNDAAFGGGDLLFANWCDSCGKLFAVNNDIPPVPECEYWASQTQSGSYSVLKAQLANFSANNCTIDQVNVSVVQPTGNVAVSPSVINLSPSLPPGAWRQLPALAITGTAATAGSVVCLRFELINVDGSVCCAFDHCTWLPCSSQVTDNGGGGGGTASASALPKVGSPESNALLSKVFDNWATGGEGDLNGDGIVDGADLSLLLDAVEVENAVDCATCPLVAK